MFSNQVQRNYLTRSLKNKQTFWSLAFLGVSQYVIQWIWSYSQQTGSLPWHKDWKQGELAHDHKIRLNSLIDMFYLVCLIPTKSNVLLMCFGFTKRKPSWTVTLSLYWFSSNLIVMTELQEATAFERQILLHLHVSCFPVLSFSRRCL